MKEKYNKLDLKIAIYFIPVFLYQLIPNLYKSFSEKVKTSLNSVDFFLKIDKTVLDSLSTVTSLCAEENKHAERSEFIQQHNIHRYINIPTKEGKTVLMQACESGGIDNVRLLLSHFDNININYVNKIGDSALALACKNNHLQIVKILISDKRFKGIDEASFIYAFEQDNINIIKKLVSAKPANKISQFGLPYACIKNQTKIALVLSEHVNVDSANRALIYASQQNNIEIITKLLQVPGVDPNIQLYDTTPLIETCKFGFEESTAVLLKHPKVDINKTNSLNQTPLMYACNFGYLNSVKALIRQKTVDVNESDNMDKTALMYACAKGHAEIVEVLLNHPNIDINKLDNTNKTALIVACLEGHSEIVQKLCARPDIQINTKNCVIAPVSSQSMYFFSFLEWICRDRNKISSIKILLKTNQFTEEEQIKAYNIAKNVARLSDDKLEQVFGSWLQKSAKKLSSS